MKTHSHKLCSLGGDMLAYLYDEMPASDRDSFELHLADCGTCIDDFAELSQSRYPVYEWKTTEFEPLPTPRIVIPYSENVGVSIFGKLKAAFSFNPGLATAGVFATLLIAAIIGFAVIMNDNSAPDVAQSNTKPPPSPESSASTATPTQDSVTDPDLEKSEPNTSRNSSDEGVNSVDKVEVKPHRRAVETKPVPVRIVKRVKPERRIDLNIPVLSRVEDDEDESLRLADLLDEIGRSE